MLLYHDLFISEKYFSYLNAHENSGILDAMKSNFGFFLSFYLPILNLLAFFACGWDKHLARQHRWRIPERALLAFAWLGGAAGMLLGMHLFRHKTRHWYFVYGLPAILVLQAVLFFAILNSPIQIQIM